MSMLKWLGNMGTSAAKGASDFMRGGMLHHVMSPGRTVSSAGGGGGARAWEMMGQNFLGNGSLMPMAVGESGAMTFGGAAMVAAGVGSLGYTAVQGYQDEGISGMGKGMVWETAVSAATLKHGYDAAGAVKWGGLGRGMIGGGVGASIGGAIGGALGNAVPGYHGLGFMGYSVGSTVGAMVGAAHMGKLSLAAGGLAMAGVGAYAAGNAVVGTLKAGRDFRRQQRNIHTSGSLAAFNTRGAATMRQRAVQAIHKSHTNARSALGQEANFMHRPSVNYNSRYRR